MSVASDRWQGEDLARVEQDLRRQLVELSSHAATATSHCYNAMTRNMGMKSLLYMHRDQSRKAIKEYCQKVSLMQANLIIATVNL